MRKHITIFLIWILVLTNSNGLIMNSRVSDDLTLNSIKNIDNPIINNNNKDQILQNLNNLDGFFTENRGQVDNDTVRYYIQGKDVWFLDDGVVFEIREEISIKGQESRGGSRESDYLLDPLERLEPPMPPEYKKVVIKLRFEGANRVSPKGYEILSHRSNFFYGNISSKWCSNVPNFREIVYENIYNNIDLKYYLTSKGLKYDFIIHPNGNINEIKLQYENVEDLWVDNLKNLNIQTPLGNIIDSNLIIYQKIGSDKKIINGKFDILNLKTYGFNLLERYDKNKDLIIDPLIYSTFVGSVDDDCGLDNSVDSNGSTYVTGWTRSISFPNTTGVNDSTHNGELDVFVFKLNSNGSTVLFSTFIGGNNWDYGFNIEIDTKLNIYVTGYTRSIDFPTTINSYDQFYNGEDDIFVFKLNSTASLLIYSTFIGGSNLDWGEDIIIDTFENSYIIGRTFSSDFPYIYNAYDNIFNGELDLFVLKLDSNGSSLLYSTYIGGTSWDYGLGIVIDSNYNAIITGETNSTDFPSTNGTYDPSYNGGFDIFVTKLNHNGSKLIFSTFIGSNKGEGGDSITIDSEDNIYITGWTDSPNFPVTSEAYDKTKNGFYDVVIIKLDSLGSSLIYSTFIGGNLQQSSSDVKLDPYDNIFVIGSTRSADFPNTTNAYDNNINGLYDVFVLVLNSIGSSLLYSTFIGGNSYDWGVGIAIDSIGDIYATGFTSSNDFPNIFLILKIGFLLWIL